MPIQPPDLKRCQAESRAPHQPFRMGFPAPRWLRCEEPAALLLIEATRKSDGRGVMSVCAECRRIYPDQPPLPPGAIPHKVVTESPPVIEAPLAPFEAAHRLGGDAAVMLLVDAWTSENPASAS